MRAQTDRKGRDGRVCLWNIMKQEQTRAEGRTGDREEGKSQAFDVFTYKVDAVWRWSRQWEATMATRSPTRCYVHIVLHTQLSYWVWDQFRLPSNPAVLFF